MAEDTAFTRDMDFNRTDVWLARAAANGANCFVCKSIAAVRKAPGDALRPLKLGGVEMTPEVQLDHLARCLRHSPDTACEGAEPAVE